MKKNIRIAAALCAAVFALPVLAGCDLINGDKSENGGTGENPFKGKTIEQDWTYGDLYYRNAVSFTTDTQGIWVMDCRAIDAISRDGPHYDEMPFTYALESVNGKNFLRIVLVSDEEGEEAFLQEYEGVSEKTKALLVEREMTVFWYYEFGENDTVKISSRYYAGDISKSGEAFENVYDNTAEEYVNVDFRRKSLRLQWYKNEPGESDESTGGSDNVSGEGVAPTDTDSDDGVAEFSNSYGRTVTEKSYWGIPEFSGNDFSAEMYSVDESDKYKTKVSYIGILKGRYDIPGMTATGKCTGTVHFTEFPAEMQGTFEKSYSVQNWDPKHDNEEYDDWDEFRIVTN